MYNPPPLLISSSSLLTFITLSLSSSSSPVLSLISTPIYCPLLLLHISSPLSPCPPPPFSFTIQGSKSFIITTVIFTLSGTHTLQNKQTANIRTPPSPSPPPTNIQELSNNNPQKTRHSNNEKKRQTKQLKPPQGATLCFPVSSSISKVMFWLGAPAV